MTKGAESKHPIQPLIKDENGCVRFKANKIVRFLLETNRHDLNDLAGMKFSNEDWIQFAQLIGYSQTGFGELSYVDDETYAAADTMRVDGKSELEARNEHLRVELNDLKEEVRNFVTKVFSSGDPTDLK